MSLGENIREKRKAFGLTQEDLGERLGMAGQTVSKWERNESMPDAALLPKLADSLGCSLDGLFDRKTREYLDAAAAVRDWLLTLRGRERWDGALRLGRIVQTVLAGFWDDPSFAGSIEGYDAPMSATGLALSDEGYTFSSRGEALPYLLLFPEPKQGWGPLFKEDDPACWQALAREPVRRALYRLYAGELPKTFDRSWARERGGLEEETLTDLIRLGALNVLSVRINGTDSQLFYSDYPLCLLTVLLMSTVKKDTILGFSSYGRKAPFLREKAEE